LDSANPGVETTRNTRKRIAQNRASEMDMARLLVL
jgi:hypothetical protein